MNDLAPSHDTESFDLANARLKLRDGLQFVLREHGGEATYVVTDPVSSRFHQIGLSQYALMSALDGRCTLDQVVRRIASELPRDAFTGDQAAQTAGYLLHHQLAVAVHASGERIESVHRLTDGHDQITRQRIAENQNPLFMKWRLGDPSGWLDRVTPWFHGLMSPTAILMASLLMILAAMKLWQSSDDVLRSMRGIADPGSAIWLALTFVCLKVVHEMGHAVACHRFGGRVRETGLVFILFVPIPYVDVTSAWGFASRRQRMLVSAAGMWVEMIIAAVAGIAWSMSVDPLIRFHLMNVVLMGTLTTFLFNANFLMRFDGYFLLSDGIGIPNLAAAARSCLATHAKRGLLGIPAKLSDEDYHRRHVLVAYGIAAMGWRLVVCVGLAMVASRLFYGFGLLLAIASVLMWFGRPTYRFVRWLLADDVDALIARRHLMTRTAPLVAGMLVLLAMVPWPWHVSAPAVVQHRDPQIIRTATPGFIREICIADGQWVQAGQTLVRLEDPELDSSISIVRARREASAIRMRNELAAGNVASYQAERSVEQSLQTRLDELLARRDACCIRSPAAGQVFAPVIDERVGQYCREGSEVCQLIDPQRKEIRVSIDQGDVDAFVDRQGEPIQFHATASLDPVHGCLDRVNSHASEHTDARLTASAGGPLAQRQTNDAMLLVRPRIEATVALDAEASRQVMAGMTGDVHLSPSTRSIASELWRRIVRLISLES